MGRMNNWRRTEVTIHVCLEQSAQTVSKPLSDSLLEERPSGERESRTEAAGKEE